MTFIVKESEQDIKIDKEISHLVISFNAFKESVNEIKEKEQPLLEHIKLIRKAYMILVANLQRDVLPSKSNILIDAIRKDAMKKSVIIYMDGINGWQP